MNWERIAYKAVLFVAMGIITATFAHHMELEVLPRVLFLVAGGLISGVLVGRWTD